MKRDDVLAALRKAIPGNADYGKIDYIKLASADRTCLLKQADAVLEADSNRPRADMLKHTRLGMEEW